MGSVNKAQLTAHSAERVTYRTETSQIAALRAEPRVGTELGATVLLVPGFTGAKEDFAPLIDPLTAVGFAVVCVDMPGQYESDGPVAEHAYVPAKLGAVIAGLVRELAATGDKVLLLGHSYGGLVVRGAVLADAPIKGLTLLCSGPAALPKGPRLEALVAGEPFLREHGMAKAWAIREELNRRVHEEVVDQALQDYYRDRFLATSAESLLGMGHGLRTEPDRTSELAELLAAHQIPSLVACGVDDNAWSPSLQRTMAQRLGADYAAIPASAHSPAVEHPEALLDVLIATWQSWLKD
jgi:pimeloyl-ACP methyl ester carboxylesterase